VTRATPHYDGVISKLPLLHRTPASWAVLAASELPTFLSDHAICEQQAALTGLNLIAHYPDDDDLVQCMSSLAAEETVHLRRVTRLLHARSLCPARRRSNPYVQALLAEIDMSSEKRRKMDRLLVGALIEARSCERFTRLLDFVADEEVQSLLLDLGPAEKRHWEMFHRLASRTIEPTDFDRRWREWLSLEATLIRARGTSPTVHG